MLDAGVFIEERNLEGVTVKEVAEEVQVPVNVRIIEPDEKYVNKVKEAAEKTGDLDVLSKTDIKLLALALQINGVLITNDFAMQNVAKEIGITFEPIGKGIKRKIEWEWYCPACKRTYKRKGICEFCGSLLKRRPKGLRRSRRDRDL